MSDIVLTPQQLAVICALSSGLTTLAAAEQAGVHRNTIANWRRNQLPFQRALADAQYDRALYFREKIETEVDLAIQTLHDLLTDPKTPASIRLKAALAILNTAATPPLPKKQIELIVETVTAVEPRPESMHKPAQPEPPKAEPQPVHKPAQPAPPPAAQPEAQRTHNDAQPTHPEPVHIPAQPPAAAPRFRRPTARNAQCPCGSGKKYKRCCQDLSATQPLANAA